MNAFARTGNPPFRARALGLGGRPGRHERGQAAVFLVLALGIFLIGSIGFVVDGANLWFHRQSAQTAVDAACSAAAMDLLSQASGVTPPDPNWISNGTTAFTCDGSMDDRGGSSQPDSGLPPCSYASINGYSGSLKNVQVQLMSQLNSGGNSVVPACSGYTLQVCAADDIVATPYAKVDITDNVQMTFIRMLGMGPTTAVAARTQCGLSNVLSAVPILVLNPNVVTGSIRGTFATDPGFSLTVINGPERSIQVNSLSSDVDLDRGTIDLSQANGGNGGDIAVGKREPEPTVKHLQINGNWVDAAGLISDPFATIDPPQKPTQDCTTGACVTTGTLPACPSGARCDIYQPGYYGNGICVSGSGCTGASQSGLAVFQSGVYYLDGDFVADTNSCLRPADSLGTVFYFHGNHTLRVTANSGGLVQGSFNCQDTGAGVQASTIQCPSGTYSNLPPGVTTLTGNVLLAPCAGIYGDPQDSGARGMLFFQDRDAQLPTTDQPTWGSAGSYGLVGNLYFHYCESSAGAGSGANCNASAFSDTLSFVGGSGYVIGDIVADQLFLTATSSTTVMLNPNPQYYVLKASLLQ